MPKRSVFTDVVLSIRKEHADMAKHYQEHPDPPLMQEELTPRQMRRRFERMREQGHHEQVAKEALAMGLDKFFELMGKGNDGTSQTS